MTLINAMYIRTRTYIMQWCYPNGHYFNNLDSIAYADSWIIIILMNAIFARIFETHKKIKQT